VPHNPENRAQNPLPEESGRPSQMKKGAKSKPVRIGLTGNIGGVGRQPNAQPRPLPCWFKPTCSEAAPPCGVRIGWKDETEPKPERLGQEGKPRTAPGPKATNFCAENASARNPSRVPLPDESGKPILLQWLICRRRPWVSSHATGSDSSSREGPRDHRFHQLA